jgi:hypothetical protein
LRALERQLEARGFLATGELDARLRGEAPPARGRRKLPAWQRAIKTWLTRKAMGPMPPWLLRAYPRVQGFSRQVSSEPAFKPGDLVRAVSERPAGHTRIPGYLCGRLGTVRRAHGAMVFPDVHARGRTEDPRHLYTVAFDGQEVWGPGSEPGVVLLADLFEPYLEAA